MGVEVRGGMGAPWVRGDFEGGAAGWGAREASRDSGAGDSVEGGVTTGCSWRDGGSIGLGAFAGLG